MPTVDSLDAFKQTLVKLPSARQRLVGARFIGNVLDLVVDHRIRDAQAVASDPAAAAEELRRAYHAAHSAYAENNPRSDLAELDWRRQAAHFVAEACMVCLAPLYGEVREHHIADKVASYCQMARICASIRHQGDYPDFQATEEAARKEIQAQFRLLEDFVAKE